MFHSGEIRWFLEGAVPDEIRDWFTADSMAVDEDPRVDEYLVLSECTTTGVKFRQYPGDDRASFEIKARTSEPVAVSIGDDVQGQMDTWVKWSCRPTEVNSFRDSITAGNDQWVFVEKCRCLRKFSMERAEPVEVDPSTMRLSGGCQFELTSIRALAGERGQLDWDAAYRWWSLSFEAFGEPESLPDYVQSVADLNLISAPVAGLNLAASRSYPAWLLGIVHHSNRS